MTIPTLDEAQLRALIDAAEQSHARGQVSEARRMLAAAREAAPHHPLVLAACGVQTLKDGDVAQARVLLEEAIQKDRSIPRLYLNLASCLRALGDADAELAALQQALTLDPYFYLANLQKGSLLEQQGKKKLAAGAFHAALSSVKPGTQIPASLRPIIEHAQRCVQSQYRELDEWLQERMKDVKARYSPAEQTRVEECIDAILGKKRIYVQQPTFTHFPGLPAITFYDRSKFDWLSAVEAATDDIRAELLQLVTSSADDFAPYVQHAPGAPLNQWKELNHSRRWSALFLFKDGQRIEDNIARCPKTMSALSHVPPINIPGRAPAVFFSLLEPNTRIPPHTGVANTRLIVHVPLIVPPGCGFRVGNDVREWQPGTALIFDDTIEHEAWNNSDLPRVVLIFDIWNPLLNEAERELMTVATVGIADFYEGMLPDRASSN